MQEALKKMKELKKSLKEQQKPSKKEIFKEKYDIKQFVDKLSELTSLSTPHKRDSIYFQESNKKLNPKVNNTPASSSHFPYIPAQQGPRPQYKCTYCLKDGHTVSRCNDLTEDIEKHIVHKTGISFYFPNFQRVPIEGEKIPRDLLRQFAAEKEVLTKNFLKEKDKQVPKTKEQKREE
ncbi:hypothetical protein O181_042345 [Austropuccinia psidii MF-1]|uniref:Uncharacterized protein n=1 Tax=Austropuccinia psidii MF-1 TaxID=1389203 RepID=A0A9Q3HI40_9BASI|nr:hypothetical protein [Austropuccinia psidii MF-1]